MLKRIELCGQSVNYDLQRKKVKNINLRIRSDGSISVSANERVPMKVIEEFLLSHQEYIIRVLDRYKDREDAVSSVVDYNDGEMVSVLGKSYAVEVRAGNENSAVLSDKSLILTVVDTSNTELKKATAEKLMRDICRKIVTEICDRVYPEFKELTGEYPVVKFRKMRTKWGVCRPTRGEITFSYMLSAAPVDCIEYVVYHEFCHFAHPDHSKNFYSKLSGFLPNWRELKKKLEAINILR